MRPIGIGLAIALIVALMAPTSASFAAKKSSDSIDPKARSQGMAEAPAVAKSVGISCGIADARFIGKNEDRKTKSVSNFYEIDCDQGPGFILQGNSAGPSTSFTCIEIATANAGGKGSGLSCNLPGNANPEASLAPLMAKAGFACTPEKARGIGQSPTNTFVEVLCPGNVGYIVVASAPFDVNKPAQVQNCLAYDEAEGNIKCTLADKASRLAIVDRYVTDAKNGCQVKDRRFVGISTEGSSFYEASCQDGKGYIYKVDAKGVLSTYDCAKAQGMLGGCTLTDARVATTEQAALYSRLSGEAGFPCKVSKYAAFPTDPSKDVVEMMCADGQGGVGVFVAGQKGVVYDCGHAVIAGYKCSLNKADTGYAALTSDLRKFDQKTCTVSNSRLVGKTSKGTILVEVGCSDGLKGYMIEYSQNPVKAVAATGCAFAGGCKLPGNV